MDVNWSRVGLYILLCAVTTSQPSAGEKEEHSKKATSEADKPHSRQKRLLWITHDGRLALPPGTTLVINPSLSLPFVRYPPDGFFSNLTISLPFTINFDKLGLTDNENPFGVLPPLLARSMGHKAGNLLANYVARYFAHRRGKRDATSTSKPDLHPSVGDAFHGGERALLYGVVEDFLGNFGLDGKACLLRAICEVHAHPLSDFGLVGEMLRLFFSASKSPYADLLDEYVQAEIAGKGIGTEGPGECWPYMKDCPKSLFQQRHNPYTEQHREEEQSVNEVSQDSTNSNSEIVYNNNINMM